MQEASWPAIAGQSAELQRGSFGQLFGSLRILLAGGGEGKAELSCCGKDRLGQ